ncbi:MAG: hypothetical protein ACXVCY_09270 [Pseudobdellovibrionaceae bacterium]
MDFNIFDENNRRHVITRSILIALLICFNFCFFVSCAMQSANVSQRNQNSELISKTDGKHSRFPSTGPGDGSGGQSIVSSENEVRFLDLVSKYDLEKKISAGKLKAQSEVQYDFFNQSPYVGQLAFEDSHFFDCAIEILNQHQNEHPVFKDLIESLKDVDVFQVEFWLPNMAEAFYLSSINQAIPYIASASNRTSVHFQSTLAAYADNQVWISKRLTQRLSQSDRCGLSVHEALRHLNFSGLLTAHLTTTEIEVETRRLMAVPEFEKDSISKSASNKLNSRTPSYELINQTADKLQYLAGIYCDRQAELNYEGAKAIELGSLCTNLSAQASALRTEAVDGILKTPRLRQLTKLGIFLPGQLKGALCKKLESNEVWDITRLQKIKK